MIRHCACVPYSSQQSRLLFGQTNRSVLQSIRHPDSGSAAILSEICSKPACLISNTQAPEEFIRDQFESSEETWQSCEIKREISIILTLFIITISNESNRPGEAQRKKSYLKRDSSQESHAESAKAVESRVTRREPERPNSLIDLINQFKFLFLLN